MADNCPKCAEIRKFAEECNNAQTDESLANEICRTFARRLFAILDKPEPEDANAKFYKEGYGD